MYSDFRSVAHRIVALTAATIFVSTCGAQEIASSDLTKITRRMDLRRPKTTSSLTSRYGGSVQIIDCLDSESKVGELRTSLRSLDRTSYQLEDEPVFEAQVENVGSNSIRIPFSPHLADLQAVDPAKKLAYSELHIDLRIAMQNAEWGGYGAVLYGDDDHTGTMLSLKPGQWVRIVGTGMFHNPNRAGIIEKLIRLNPVGRVYAQASLYRAETLITPTQAATVRREVCIAQTHEQSVPIQLDVQ